MPSLWKRKEIAKEQGKKKQRKERGRSEEKQKETQKKQKERGEMERKSIFFYGSDSHLNWLRFTINV